jgi:anaerobic selenocysteine-containing dehydrogenase
LVEALKKVDFFVTIDVTRPAEMDYADIVLPTTTPMRRTTPFEVQGSWIMAAAG